ncbi:MAG: ATP synthase F1 subunit gamma [Dehalococcoidia bacterium]
MPSTRELRRRIRSVQNTAKVTKAMQLIAASKMRRAQQMVVNGRAYSEKMRDVMADLVAHIDFEEDAPSIPLLSNRPVEKTVMLLITPDRGLCGGLVSNMNRAAGEVIRSSDTPVSTVAIGRKGETFIIRTGQDLRATFSVSDRPSLEDTVSITRMLMDEYEEQNADRVLLAYPEFINAAVQRPVIRTLLPVEPAEADPEDSSPAEEQADAEFIYEPDPAGVLGNIVPRYVETQVYHAILEAIASEHSARMVAMRNATDNANDLTEDLTLALNKARQETITAELLDIVGGVAAVGG